MELLEYENQIFLDQFQEDGLLVMARGLGIERIITAFLKIYCDPASLVLVLNTTAAEEEFLTDQLQTANVKPLPRTITADCSTEERKGIYLEGGVLFITTRILVVDMLVERIPIHLVSGILVYKAHKVIESCQEAFILRLYRLKNKTGFIKAFSDSPTSFTAGFCQVERVMKSLFVRKLYLWPRFQASVVGLLSRHQIDVVELHVELTEVMQSCQMALLELIDVCIKELKRGNRVLDTDDITVEYAITKRFDKIIHVMVDPIWHQLSSKTKQLIQDLKTLRQVLLCLTEYDCVNFYHLVHSIRGSEKIFGSNAGWLFTDAAEHLFVNAKKRLYKPVDNKAKKPKTSKTAAAATTSTTTTTTQSTQLELQFEECPKWHALKDVLDEIEENCRTSPSTDLDATCRILIAAQDDRMCSQIQEYLCRGGELMLTRLYERVILQKKTSFMPQQKIIEAYEESDVDEFSASPSKCTRSRSRGGSASTSPVKSKTRRREKKGASKTVAKNADMQTLTQWADKNTKMEDLSDKMELGSDDPSAAAGEAATMTGSRYSVKTSPLTILHPLRGSKDPNSLLRTLNEVMPTYVILYDADMTFVRHLEVFKARHPDQPLRVYFLMYKGSVEEQRYLTTLRSEKEAFEYLIRQKARMVIPVEREGKTEDSTYLSRDVTPAAATVNVNTRKGGYQTTVQQRIIVDMREFRSELPSLIHRRGIDIDPVTLEVGDYILTPDICVERKSVSDLIGSLNNGRLYNQCVAMCRSYRRPVLLIEFDPSKPFTLQDRYPIYGEINSNDAISRLTLLTMHFPRLRVMWCPSPYTSAELFDELKVGRDQPVVEKALAISGDDEKNHYAGRYNSAPQDMLLKMPGINSRNVYAVMNRVENLAELVRISLDDLTQVLGGPANAKLLHDFIHADDQLHVAAPPATINTATVAVATAAGATAAKTKPMVSKKTKKTKRKFV